MAKLKDGDTYYWTFMGIVKKVTDNGGVLVFDGKQEVWLALSHIYNKEDIGEGVETEIIIPVWLAEEKGII